MLTLAACGQQGFQPATAVLKADPVAVDFGDQPVLTPITREIKLRNIGRATLTFGEAALIQMTGQTAFTVTAGLPLEQLAGAKDETIVVRFSAPSMGEYSATLLLSSNDSKQPNLAIPITGKGTTAATVDVTPPCLEFGRVCEGHSKIKATTIASAGTAPLLVNRLELTSATNASFGAVGSWSTTPPLQLAAHEDGHTDESRDISVVFRPTAATVDASGMATGTLEIGTNDPLQQTVSVCLTGTMQKEPEAKAGVDQIVAPGDTVQLDGSASVDPGGSGLTYQWSLLSRPQGSAAAIDTATSSTVMSAITLDQPGAYVVGLTVSDGVCSSSVPAKITLTAAASQDMRIELVWDNPTVDLDLHVRPRVPGSQSPLYGVDDCWWDTPNQVWGNGTAHNTGDVLAGFGPESVVYENMVPGDVASVIASVVYSSSNGAADPKVNAKIRVLMYGVQIAEFSHLLTHPGTFPTNMGETWDAAVVEWPTGHLSTP